MGKRIRKCMAGILALLMMLGSLNTTSMEAKAANIETVTYSMADIVQTDSWETTAEDISGGGKVLTFGGNWKSIFFAVPEDVEFGKVERVTFHVTSDNAHQFAYKFFTETDYANKGSGETQVQYGNPVVIPRENVRAGIKYMAITSNFANGQDATPIEMEISGISFEINHDAQVIVPEGIQTDIPDWKDAITRDLGADAIAGACVAYHGLSDALLMELTTKHFNAISFENEMKPDAFLGSGTTQTVTFNGESMVVPVLNFSRADSMLDYIKEWNDANPDDFIKVRGHVLVWHSQTPEWFFREDYDASADYVSTSVMNKRLEWYIKTVLEHFVGEDSEYKDMFYGWDVVNEAISDSTAKPRMASENSSWAAVYGDQSNEYIINAFKYAHKYAPASLELYYNDYNDSDPNKSVGIANLLRDVKNAEGTRIDGMGMQAHHNMQSPSVGQIEAAVRRYAAIVDKIQLTELDIKASGAYDGTSATREEEFKNMGHRYKEIYDVLKALDAEDGIDITGITMWGVVDKYSWLQSSNSVGGAASGGAQCPLLFDDYYQAKPAYWAFVDATKLPPERRGITVIKADELNFDMAPAYSVTAEDTTVSLQSVVVGNELSVLVTVEGANTSDSDTVTLYVDGANSESEDITPVKVSATKKNGVALANGYRVILETNIANADILDKLGLDIVVTKGDKKIAFNDTTLSQETSSKYYAEAVIKPYANIGYGTANVDGIKEDAWGNNGTYIPLDIHLNSGVVADATAMWDEEYLYVFMEVQDATLNNSSSDAWQQDSVEVFIDENNHKTESYEADDKQYRISYTNEQSFNGTKCNADNVISAARSFTGGYEVEAAFKWTDITPAVGMEIGLEFQINDAGANATRIGTVSWFDETGLGWSSTAVYGTAKLLAKEEETVITRQPADQSVAVGEAAVFAVEAEGSDLSYQWQFRTSETAKWTNSGMTGSKTNSITVQGTKARNGYQYRCVITDRNGEQVISEGATLTVKDVLAITAQPASKSVTEGDSATFKVTATGEGLKYQWQFKKANETQWKDSGMEGATTNSITVQGTKARNGYQYRCIITDGSGKQVTSEGATLTVEAKLAITMQPASKSVTEGDSVAFTVTAIGNNLKYQWQFKKVGATTWTDSGMVGSTTNSITVQGTKARNGYQYRCVITDGSGNKVTSNGATLGVQAGVTITAQPASKDVTEGDKATFIVTAIGNDLKYQWQVKTSEAGKWANSGMTGATTNSIAVQGTKARNGYQYRCVVTDGSGNKVTSDAATLTVSAKFAITSQPESKTVAVGENAAFKVVATGSDLKYQWQVKTSEAGKWANSGMTGATTNSITVRGTAARNGYQYRCVITDGNGNKVTSESAVLTVK